MLSVIENVSLRDFKESDIPNKVVWINNPKNNTFLHYNIPLNEKDTLSWYLKKNNEIRRDYVIEYNNIPVGLIGLLSIDKENKKAEYYISMGETNYKRKGIATKASKILLKYAFLDLGLNKVYLNVDAENTIACKLYEKIGFICEGIFKEDLMFKGRLVDRKRYAMMSENFIERYVN